MVMAKVMDGGLGVESLVRLAPLLRDILYLFSASRESHPPACLGTFYGPITAYASHSRRRPRS